MAQLNRVYRVRICKLGETTVDDTTTDLIIGMNDLKAIPQTGGSQVRLLEGKTETRSWSVEAIDRGGRISALLSSPSTGRLQMITRLVELQVADNGGAWVTVATGRLTNISETEGAGSYSIQVEDERWMERRSKIFEKTTTTVLYPGNYRYQWAGYVPTNMKVAVQKKTKGSPVTHVKVEIQDAGKVRGRTFWESLKKGDAHHGRNGSNFDYMACCIGGVDYPIVSFTEELDSGDYLENLDKADEDPHHTKLRLWVYAPGGIPFNNKWLPAYIHAFGAPVTSDHPLHIGCYPQDFWTATSPARNDPPPYPSEPGSAAGIHPFRLVKMLYDECGVRYNAAALDALIADARYPLIAMRVTEPWVLSDFLEQHIFAPLGVIPFIDQYGVVTLRSVTLPQNVDPLTLFEFNAGNLIAQPTWDHGSDEMHNVIKAEGVWWYSSLNWDTIDGLDTDSADEKTGWPGFVYKHDNVALMGEQQVTLNIKAWPGFPEGVDWGAEEGDNWNDKMARRRIKMFEPFIRETLARYGDGPVQGKLQGMLSTGSVTEGDLVLINLSTFPNPSVNGRGGVRIVQILQKRIYPDYYEFDYIDVGANLNPMVTPFVSASQYSASPEYGIVVDVSALVDDVNPAWARVQVSDDGGNTWAWDYTAQMVTGSVQFIVTGLRSGTTYSVRAMQFLDGRISSAWSATETVTTASLPAPSGMAVATSDSGTATVTWTNASSALYMEILFNQGGVPGEGWNSTSYGIGVLPPGSSRYTFEGLSSGTQYSAAVRYIDSYGGAGAVAQVTFTTSLVLNTAPRPAGICLFFGDLT
jgi:hypothetical protein